MTLASSFISGSFNIRDSTESSKESFIVPQGNWTFSSQFVIEYIWCTTLITSLCFLQAAYNVGGHTISVDIIQRSILGCRLPRPGQVSSLSEKNYFINEAVLPLLHTA